MKLLTVCTLLYLPQILCFKNCQQYCNKTPHTQCYPQGGGKDCKNNAKVYLNTNEKRAILDFHNDKRNKISEGYFKEVKGKSSDMMKLVWNGEMGMLAKRWADQCKGGQHDECRTARDGNETGQNSFIGRYKNTGSINEHRVSERYDRIMMMLNTWFSEIKIVEETDIRSFDKNRTAAIGNVTQMIWAETIYVGCGYTEFTLKDKFLMYRFVCDYKPSGNIHSKAVYSAGTPCSECPEGSSCSDNFKNLCFNGATNEFTDDNEARNNKPTFYTTALFALILLFRAFSCPVER